MARSGAGALQVLHDGVHVGLREASLLRREPLRDAALHRCGRLDGGAEAGGAEGGVDVAHGGEDAGGVPAGHLVGSFPTAM